MTEKNPIGYLPLKRLLPKFAIPSIIAMIVNSIYNIVDQIFIQRGVGSNGNAATTVAFPLVTLTLALSLLIGVGGSSMAAIKLGERDKEKAEKILGNAVTLTVIVSILVCLVYFAAYSQILRLLGASEAVMPFAEDYTGIIMLGTVFMAIGSGISSFVRVDGAPNISMIGLVVGCGLNVILDPLFMFGFNMGVSGAALGTIISQFVTAVITLWYLIFKGNIRLRLKNLKPDFKLSGVFCILGLSSFITQFANAIVQVMLNNLLQHYGNKIEAGYGDTAMVGMGIVLKTNMILIGTCVGIATGIQPILGYNHGAGYHKRVRKAYVLGAVAASVITIAGWGIIELWPQGILSIYGNSDPEMIDFACKAMRLFLGGVMCAGFNIVSSHYFQAVGKPKQAFSLSMVRQVVALIPLMYILPQFMGIDGILWAGAIADCASLTLGIILITIEMKRLNKLCAKI